ncbi:hypothetical protein J6590_094019, partial [Homalodisca vitripennis]
MEISIISKVFNEVRNDVDKKRKPVFATRGNANLSLSLSLSLWLSPSLSLPPFHSVSAPSLSLSRSSSLILAFKRLTLSELCGVNATPDGSA